MLRGEELMLEESKDKEAGATGSGNGASPLPSLAPVEPAFPTKQETPNPLLKQIEAEFEIMNKKIDLFGDRDKKFNDIIEEYKKRDVALVSKIEAYENDAKLDANSSLIKELIRLRDLIESKKDILPDSGHEEAKALCDLFLMHLDVSLNRCGVTAFRLGSNKFDSALQQGVPVSTNDKSKDGLVARSLKVGYYASFRLSGEEKRRYLVYETVAVFKYQKGEQK